MFFVYSCVKRHDLRIRAKEKHTFHIGSEVFSLYNPFVYKVFKTEPLEISRIFEQKLKVCKYLCNAKFKGQD